MCPYVSLPASENDLLNKRLKLDYEEITPCLKEVTTVWEKMLSFPGRSKTKFDMEKMHSAVGQGKHYQGSPQPAAPSPVIERGRHFKAAFPKWPPSWFLHTFYYSIARYS